MIRFDESKYHRLVARAAQLNGVARIAHLSYRESRQELTRLEARLGRARDQERLQLQDADECQRAELAGMESDVESARAAFELADRNRLAAQDRWNAAATLVDSCRLFLDGHGIFPNRLHDQHTVQRPGVAR